MPLNKNSSQFLHEALVRMVKPSENPGYLNLAVLKKLKSFTAALKERITELLQIKPADRVADIGCGPGHDTITMVDLVGEKGLVVGLDYDFAMIAEANRISRQSEPKARVFHVIADAHDIPFVNSCFDACRSERLLQHVADPERVFNEMVRITKTGGKIVLADTDWATLSIDSPDFELERRIVLHRAKMYQNGCAGRQLLRMMKLGRLQAITLEVHPVVWTDYQVFRATSFALNDFEKRLIDSQTVTSSELQRFLNGLDEADQGQTFYASGNIVVVAGRKS